VGCACNPNSKINKNKEGCDPMKLEIRQFEKFGINEAIIGNLLSVFPSFLLGVFIAFGFVIPPISLLFLLVGESSFMIFVFSLVFGAICLLISLLLFYFYPLLLGINYFIKFIAGRIVSPAPEGACVCQISMTPKLCSGFRAFLEDADDVGYLTVSGDSVDFKGDSIEFSIPKSEISNVRSCNIGWRGCWIAGRRIKLTINGHERFKEIEICERHTWTIPGSWLLSKQLYDQISSLANPVPK
jgi:hypothetical protein